MCRRSKSHPNREYGSARRILIGIGEWGSLRCVELGEDVGVHVDEGVKVLLGTNHNIGGTGELKSNGEDDRELETKHDV